MNYDYVLIYLNRSKSVLYFTLVLFPQLPRMLQKDAIARYFAPEKGQVVKVTYGGEITQSHVTYRCVW